MTYTYGDIKISDLIDGELVTKVERFAGGDWEFIRVTVASGGHRTEAADHPAGPTDRTLADVSDKDLSDAADVFADHHRDRIVPPKWTIPALHGVALEMNRRAA
jgi:hypothetical protein